jgi:hypothetical protein
VPLLPMYQKALPMDTYSLVLISTDSALVENLHLEIVASPSDFTMHDDEDEVTKGMGSTNAKCTAAGFLPQFLMQERILHSHAVTQCWVAASA